MNRLLFSACGKIDPTGEFADASGQYLIVANQDSNCVSVFSFNLSTGEIKFTGNTYHVLSPNFVCCAALGDRQAIGAFQRNPQDFGTTPPRSLTVSGANALKNAFNQHLNQETSGNIISVSRELSALTTATVAKDNASADTDHEFRDEFIGKRVFCTSWKQPGKKSPS